MRNFHQHGIDTARHQRQNQDHYCPQCNDTRGHKGNKSLSVDLDKGLCYCHHCGYKLYVPDDAEERLKQQRRDMHRKPTAPAPALPPSHLRPCPDATLREPGTLLDHRPLPAAERAPCASPKRRCASGEQQEENCICFNYFKNRTLHQHQIPQRPEALHDGEGAELIPYNVDSILGTPECIITEGEFDAAAIIAAGRKDVVSVPAGAQSNLTWLDRFVESHFEDKQAIYIAVDEDPAGQSLRQELTRRLGVERCRIVHFGEGCKDANEHLVKYGAESLRICIEQAEEMPLEGIFTAEDCGDDLRSLYENSSPAGCRHRLGQLRRTLHLRAPPPAGDDRTPRRRQVRIHRRAGPAPLPAPRVENRLLQPRKHAHRLPSAQAGGEADRQHRFTPRTGHDGSRLRAGSGLAGPQHVSHPARRRELHHRPHPGEDPARWCAAKGCASSSSTP